MASGFQPANTIGWAIERPTVERGFSEPYGSWKIICTLRRISASAPPCSGAMLVPSTTISPAATGTSFMIALPRVDLPQPDSPTRPSVSPTARSRLTPDTARTTPLAVLKWTRTSFSASSDISPPPPRSRRRGGPARAW
jgi:hypothetical protein